MHRDLVEQWADAPETNSLATLAELATTSSEGVEFGPRARIAKLEEQALWYQAAMDAIALGVCLFDADARLIVSNRRYAEIYGLRPSRSVPALRCARSSSFASRPELRDVRRRLSLVLRVEYLT